jgi:hypothetical protein
LVSAEPTRHLKPTGASHSIILLLTFHAADEDDADNMEEIDTDNIITDGRRTRGRKIDFAKAAEQFPEEDEDEEDDDDFEGGEGDEDEKMED